MVQLEPDPYPPPLQALARAAVSRVRRRLKEHAPSLAEHAGAWMGSLSGDAPPERYFVHPRAFPALLLPWLLEEEIHGSPSRTFQRDVVYSTVAGYYFVRMLDDLMDAEPVRPQILPALIILHSEFQQTYHRYFPFGDPFWDAFVRGSYEAAETASRDAGQQQISRSQFLATSARKIAGAKVPIAAVCYRYGRPELLEPWSAFVDLLGRWHQMLNDMLGWNRDLLRGTATYFLSEASLRASSRRSIAEWVITDGYAWGMNELDGWMADLLAAARGLDSPRLVTYLEGRERTLAVAWEGARNEMVSLQRLARSLR